MARELNIDEQNTIKNKAKKELERLENLYTNQDIVEKIDNFKNTFLKCEIVYKILLKKYLSDCNNNSFNDEYLVIDARKLGAVLNHFGYNYDSYIMKQLFSGNKKVGEKSVKILRNDLTHKVSQSDSNELTNREEELYGYMNYFLDLIRNA